jgi:hypothetical protein
MRSDMAKVIVERPRIGSRDHGKTKGYRRTLQRLGDEGLARREGMKRRSGGGTKFLNEHLGPLRRYLDSQVGRPWDQVFAEICAHIDRDSAVQDHVRDHVADYVTTHVVLIDGVPCSNEGDRSHGQPLRRMAWWRRRHWYVCPRTGILRRVELPVRPRNAPPAPVDRPAYVRVSETLQCRWIDGAWHLVGLRPLPLERNQCPDRDVVLDRPVAEIDAAMACKHYGAKVYATGKRLLTRRELRQLPVPADLW